MQRGYGFLRHYPRLARLVHAMTEHHWFGVVDGQGRLELQLYPTHEAAHLYLGWTDGAGNGPGAKARVVEVTVSQKPVHEWAKENIDLRARVKRLTDTGMLVLAMLQSRLDQSASEAIEACQEFYAALQGESE